MVDGELALRIATWIERGGTQAPNGAFCGWRDLRTGALSAPYPEITGYVLGFLSPKVVTESAQVMRRAEVAADWLAARTEADVFSARPEKSGRAVYTFDVAMVAHGLLRYGRACGDTRFIRAGLRNVALLVTLVETYGMLPCVVPGTVDGVLPQTWSSIGQAHLLKTVQALLNAAENDLPGAADAARKVVHHILAQKNLPPAAPFLTCPGSTTISLHALCYAAEGLCIWARKQDDSRALDTSRQITEWVWAQWQPGKGRPGYAHVLGGPVGQFQTDALGQAIRLAALHQLPDIDLANAAADLARSTWRNGDQEAVLYQPSTQARHLNCWSSLFAVQALLLQTRARDELAWWELV